MIAETALTFAREIMGWEGELSVKGEMVMKADPSLTGFDKFENFIYTDLNAVMGAVRDWCRSKGLEVLVTYTPSIVYVQTGEHEGWRYVVNIQPPASPYELLGSAFGDDPCEALMLACLNAVRKQ